jgi:hypothetical protein
MGRACSTSRSQPHCTPNHGSGVLRDTNPYHSPARHCPDSLSRFHCPAMHDAYISGLEAEKPGRQLSTRQLLPCGVVSEHPHTALGSSEGLGSPWQPARKEAEDWVATHGLTAVAVTGHALLLVEQPLHFHKCLSQAGLLQSQLYALPCCGSTVKLEPAVHPQDGSP